MSRLKILNPEEILKFDSPPLLSEQERKKYFSLSDEARKFAPEFRKPHTHVGFLLQLGYFRCCGQFFRSDQFAEEDISYVCTTEGFDRNGIDIKQYRAKIAWHHQQIIASMMGWLVFKGCEQEFQEQIGRLVGLNLQPRAILEQARTYLLARHIEVPGYYTFTQAITEAYRIHEKQLTERLQSVLTSDIRELLDNLLESKDTYDKVPLVVYRKINQSRRPGKIKESLQQFQDIKALFEALYPVISHLKLNSSAINYYATWAVKALTSQMRSFSQRYLYLIAFIVHQYRMRQDTLIDILVESVRSCNNAVDRYHQAQYFHTAIERKQIIRLLIESHQHYQQKWEATKAIVASNSPAQQKLDNIHALVRAEARPKQSQEQISLLEKQVNQSEQQEYYLVLQSRFSWLNNRVGALLKCLDFNDSTSDPQLIEAIKHYVITNGSVGRLPEAHQWIELQQRRFLYDENRKFRPALYKMLLFRAVADAIKSGTLNVRDSYRYLSLEEYLIDKGRWIQEKPALLAQAELERLADFPGTMEPLKHHLHEQYHCSNRSLLQAQNNHVKFRADSTVLVETPKIEKTEIRGISELFADCRYVSILEILSDIEHSTSFLSCFEHFAAKFGKERPSNETFFAALIGTGCNIGIEKIAGISKGINPHTLENAALWYITLENVQAANECIITYQNQLALPEIFRAAADKLHTASDGQKFMTIEDSLNASYSYKYFGSGKGSTVNDSIDERFSLFYSTVISSSEREAAYVIDAHLHNQVIKSTIHSTDTHGYSEVIFAIMHLLGIYYAPRIKDVGSQQLYSFISKKQYQQLHYSLLPDRYINLQLIQDNWDDVLRLIATLKTKESTASQILKRMNSYARQHPLYKALKEFGKIIKTVFLLRYIDDVALRQAIEKQLNKIELSHKFAKAVFFGNNQEFQVGTKEEQEVVAACRRLIQNAIILWNYLYLSEKLCHLPQEHAQDTLQIIRNSSILAWQHINLHGEYDFLRVIRQTKSRFNLQKIQRLQLPIVHPEESY